ncbi:MAG: 6-phosphogluconolactonase [Clostridia bacterium]|nr:6-phosphogluconolactonase [Clostridia bacterium]
MALLKELKCENLAVEIHDTRDAMGAAAAADCAAAMKKLLAEKAEINMIFAAAPSQNEFLDHLCAEEGLDWTRVNAYHMDEYVGLAADAPQGFGQFLKRGIFDRLPFKSVNYIDITATDADAEAARYGALLTKNPADIVCMGIGENGHIAFNDPHVADFNDKFACKKVDLDEKCRQQQVNDGCFATIDDVPKYALSLTIPTLMAPKHVFCMVPGATKTWAVTRTVTGEVGEACPATALRSHADATLYCDADSGKELL